MMGMVCAIAIACMLTPALRAFGAATIGERVIYIAYFKWVLKTTEVEF